MERQIVKLFCTNYLHALRNATDYSQKIRRVFCQRHTLPHYISCIRPLTTGHTLPQHISCTRHLTTGHVFHSKQWKNPPPSKGAGGKTLEEPPYVVRPRKRAKGYVQHPSINEGEYARYRQKKDSAFKIPPFLERNHLRIFLLVFGACGFGYSYYYIKQELRKEEEKAAGKSQPRTSKVAIGRDWQLVDMNGKSVTNKSFKGKWCIIYFGFTHCPDICPDEIEKIIEVTDILEQVSHVPKIVPLFVTVDPERDTPELLKEYLKEFSPKLIGLTGTKEQLDVIYKQFKVYFTKGPVDEDGDYIVDHSIISFLMDPEGNCCTFFPRNKATIDIAAAIEYEVDKSKRWKR